MLRVCTFAPSPLASQNMQKLVKPKPALCGASAWHLTTSLCPQGSCWGPHSQPHVLMAYGEGVLILPADRVQKALITGQNDINKPASSLSIINDSEAGYTERGGPTSSYLSYITASIRPVQFEPRVTATKLVIKIKVNYISSGDLKVRKIWKKNFDD